MGEYATRCVWLPCGCLVRVRITRAIAAATRRQIFERERAELPARHVCPAQPPTSGRASCPPSG